MRIPVPPILLMIVMATVQANGPNDGRPGAPNTSRSAAESAIASVDTRAALEELRRLALDGRNEALVERISSVSERTDWPAAAREFTLFTFTLSLSDQAPGTVSPEVLQHLSAIRPGVRVPHPDDDRFGMLLFNIPAAASGTAAEWRRREATMAGRHALSRGTQRWLDGYRAGDTATRTGYLASLDGAAPAMLDGLANAVEREPADLSGRAAVLARIGIALSDEERFARALGAGRIPGLTRLARDAATAFDTRQALRTLDLLETTAPAQVTSLVLAAFAGKLTRDADGTQHLFELVGHESLGLTAAIALARHGDDAARRRLGWIADDGEDDASRHATIALTGSSPPGAEP